MQGSQKIPPWETLKFEEGLFGSRLFPESRSINKDNNIKYQLLIKNTLLVLLKVAAAIQLKIWPSPINENIGKIIIKILRDLLQNNWCRFSGRQCVRYFSVSTELFPFKITHCKNFHVHSPLEVCLNEKYAPILN